MTLKETYFKTINILKLIYVIPDEWRIYQQRQHQRYYQPSSDL